MKSRVNDGFAKVDRRTLRTKKSLADALKQLILEKDYDSITIQDTIDRANVGRSTFYSHYEGKEQLLVGNINFQEQLIYAREKDASPMGINLTYMFEHTREHLPLYKAMVRSRGKEMLGEYFMDLCAGKIMEYMRRRSSDRKMLRYKAEAAAGGIVRMMFKWLEDGAKTPSKELVDYAKKLLHDLTKP
jgi:hypothetical protein